MNTAALLKFLPQVLGILILAGAFYRGNPYSYYQILRIAIFGIAIYLLIRDKLHNRNWFNVCIIATAIIYNPFLPISLSRGLWEYMNAITIVMLAMSWSGVTRVKNQDSFNKSIETLAEYREAIEHYISWAGFYETLIVLREVDYVLKRAEVMAVSSLFKNKTAYKVAGALIIDALDKYESDKEMGIKYLLALINPDEAQEYIGDSDDDNFHEQFDLEVEYAKRELEGCGLFIPLRGNGLPLDIQAILLSYIACYVAILESGKNMDAMAWNSFKRSTELSILAVNNFADLKTGSNEHADPNKFSHNTSKYWGTMSRMEDQVLKSKAIGKQYSPNSMLEIFNASLGNDENSDLSDLISLFDEIKHRAAIDIIPRVIRAFR